MTLTYALQVSLTEAQTGGRFGGANVADAQIDSSASATAGHSLGTAKEDLSTIAGRLYSARVTTPFLGTESQQLASIRQAYLGLPGANPKVHWCGCPPSVLFTITLVVVMAGGMKDRKRKLQVLEDYEEHTFLCT